LPDRTARDAAPGRTLSLRPPPVPDRDRIIIARDGLRARDNGAWAREKLSFLDWYLPTALDALQKKRERHFVDLFAGPGTNVDRRRSQDEFEGSTLRALQLRGERQRGSIFTHVHAVNLDGDDHAALTERIDRAFTQRLALAARENVHTLRGDANGLLRSILAPIDPRAFVFVFADIEAPRQWPWRSVQTLRDFGHQSIELCVLFPLEMSLLRMISFNAETNDQNATALTRFYGDDSWRRCVQDRVTSEQQAAMRQALLQLYVDKLIRLGWTYTRVTRDVRREDGGRLYKLIHATAHQAGDNIAKWEVKKDQQRDQYDLGLG
jgi:three-Cys-motif partner protein